MINEREEFAAYTGKRSYTAVNKNDRTWMGRFTFDMLKEFEGMARVLTIVARGYMWESDTPDCDRARRALCAWCSSPANKNANVPEQEWRYKITFPEYSEEFPELVDEKGLGWLYRHVKNLCGFAKQNPDLIDVYAGKSCDELIKSFVKILHRKLVHYQVPVFSDTTDNPWSLSFDNVIADALELGRLREAEPHLTEEETEVLRMYKPKEIPMEMLEVLAIYYKANKPEDSDWVVLPVTNFDAYFGRSSFSRKYLNKIPKELIQRDKQSYGISRYKMDFLIPKPMPLSIWL